MKRYLILEDGSIYEGEGFGADCESSGEVVFKTIEHPWLAGN